MLVSPDGSQFYVTNANAGTVSVYVPVGTVDALAGTITVGNGPLGGQAAVSPDGNYLYVTNPDDDTVSVISV